MAGTLWPEKPSDRAAGNLRTVIWRLPAGVVETTNTHLSLASVVHCDVVEQAARARRLIDGAVVRPADLDHELYGADLLPASHEDWVAIERERIRQQQQAPPSQPWSSATAPAGHAAARPECGCRHRRRVSDNRLVDRDHGGSPRSRSSNLRTCERLWWAWLKVR